MREIEGTFCFVDLAGYTAATWVHGDNTAAALAIRLVELAEASCAPDDAVVKSIGDAVLLRSHAPESALRLLGALWDAADGEPSFPHLRGGVHHGTGVEHRGDYYGSTINVAARIAGIAAPDEIVATKQAALAAADAGWHVDALGPRSLRNISTPIDVFSVSPSERCASAIDPICQMRVDVATAITIEADDATVAFCSEECAQVFRTQQG